MRGRNASSVFANSVLVGAVTVLVIIVAVFLSYNANKGLPFVATFKLNADVPDAQQLVKNSEVRIGGFRVGQVVDIVAMPAARQNPILMTDLISTRARFFPSARRTTEKLWPERKARRVSHLRLIRSLITGSSTTAL